VDQARRLRFLMKKATQVLLMQTTHNNFISLRTEDNSNTMKTWMTAPIDTVNFRKIKENFRALQIKVLTTVFDELT